MPESGDAVDLVEDDSAAAATAAVGEWIGRVACFKGISTLFVLRFSRGL